MLYGGKFLEFHSIREELRVRGGEINPQNVPSKEN